MSKQVLKQLPVLVNAGVISEDTAANIRRFYSDKASDTSRLFYIFAFIGSVLVGLGIILLVAHNWDQFPKEAKIAVAMLPLALGQILAAFAFFKTRDNLAWHEGSAVFLLFAIAAAIALISQVYNIPGDLSDFLFTWILLVIPLVYVLKSAAALLIVVCLLTWYGSLVGYSTWRFATIPWHYWWMLAALFPPVYYLLKDKRLNWFYLHTWGLAISVAIMLGTFGERDVEFLYIAFMGLFSFYTMAGDKLPKPARAISNGLAVVGDVGAVGLLVILTFKWPWKEVAESSLVPGTELYAAVATSLIALVTLVSTIRRSSQTNAPLSAYLFAIFIPTFFIGYSNPQLGVLLTNVLVLLVAVFTMKVASVRDDLYRMNYGLLILAVLVTCRFFDSDLTFVVRGALFILVGLCFFGANFWMLRRRKSMKL